MHQHTRWIPIVSLLLLVVLIAATTISTGVTYTTNTSMDVSGVVGSLLKKAGTDKIAEESFFTADKMATKTKTSRTIIDLNAETITSVNDLTKTYTVIPRRSLPRRRKRSSRNAWAGSPKRSPNRPPVGVRKGRRIKRPF